MKHIKLLLLAGIIISSNHYTLAQGYSMSNGRKVFASPEFKEGPKALFATSDQFENTVANLATNSAALPITENGIKKLTEQNFSDAQEAFRTALRIEPMNMQLWQLYNDAVIGEYTQKKRDDILKSVIEADLTPTFSITRVDSYTELGTLYIVGTVKNTSSSQRQKITLKARLLDNNKRELRSEKGYLRSIDKILYPNESSLFEISFKNPPSNIKSYRVEVSSWE